VQLLARPRPSRLLLRFLQPERPLKLETLTPPAVEPLSLEQGKRWLNLWQDLTDQDDDVADLIQSCREVLERRTARAFLTQTLRETRVIPASGVVRLLRAPVQALESVEIDGEPVEDVGALAAVGESRYSLGSPGRTAVITYRAGYGDAPEAVPATARTAIRALLAWAWDNRSAPDDVPPHVASLAASLSWGGELPPA